jgi:glycosyltransferase involved in cell wall biosynthesis
MISIITTAYNNDSFLKEALDSFIESCGNIEYEILLGIDNCDKTFKHVMSFYDKINPKVKIFFFDKKVGTYIIRNTLATISKFDNLIFFDSDDVMRKHTVPHVIESFNNGCELFRFKHHQFSGKLNLSKTEKIEVPKNYHTGAFGIKKKFFESYNGFEPWICAADAEFIWRMSSNNLKTCESDDFEVFYRRHPESLTSNKKTGMQSELRKGYHEIRNNKIQNRLHQPLPSMTTSTYVSIDKNFYDRFKNSKFKIVTVSAFWNSGKYTKECVESLKKQKHTNFISYFIDDMSTDNSYEMVKNAIGDDDRFVLIKNTKKKYKTKNFIDVIRDNNLINNDDVIIELDGDDKLSDESVLEKINNVFTNDDIWLCGTRWKDRNGVLGNYGKPNPEKARSTVWNFSHMRSFRAFLFRQIKDEDLKMKGEYFKGSCDIGHAIPMLEMSGSEHFHYINEPLYIYTWHSKQSYSVNGGIGDKTTQSKTGSYIYRLPKYGKLNPIDKHSFIDKNNKVLEILGKVNHKKTNKEPINYEQINKTLIKNEPKSTIQETRPIKQNTPNNRQNLIELKKDGSLSQIKKMFKEYPTKKRYRDI